jgi:anti-sigma factor RsiW
MNIDDTVLLLYVDGLLGAQQRAEVQDAVARSAELARRLSAMQTSVLPYRAAFDRQELPALPARLAERIAHLASAATRTRAPVRHHSYRLALAASFVAGTLLCGALQPLWLAHAPTVSRSMRVSPWIQAVADYQMLYSRETLMNISEDHALTEKIVGDLRRDDGMAVRVPDLRSAGLTFKRVQRLSFHQQPVVQMVYVSERGDPIALCVTRDTQPDDAPYPQRSGEMNVVAWRRDQLAYVLLGKDAQSELLALARRVAHGDTATLYGADS